MSTVIKLSKPQISKIIQSDGFFGSWLAYLGKTPVTDLAIPLARDNLPTITPKTFLTNSNFRVT